jgi:hypothetical protein
MPSIIESIIDLDAYPLHRAGSAELAGMVNDYRKKLAANGMFNLSGFVRKAALAQAVAELQPLCDRESYVHQRRHNVFFKDRIEGLAPDHPALIKFDTANQTLCGDQFGETIVREIYDWAPLRAFLAAILQKPALHPMADPLACANVMEYRDGQTLNWHFDRSQFTTTLLLRGAEVGGDFEYCTGLRTDTAEDYTRIARVVRGDRTSVRINPLAAGTLNIFAGRNTLHRVSTVRGRRSRLIAVFSYFDQPGVSFTAAERLGFYGRAN